MDNDLQRVKQLILGEEYEELLALKDRLNDDKAFAALIANVIAEALAARGEQDNGVAEVLAPTIDKAISESIDQDPRKLAESLYPIMGPAIRKSISETLQQMLENFNHLLEDSFSPKALRWRFDAWRTGTPYSEYIMLQTLDYQVEQVFLIHKESSLLIQHHFSDLVETQDPDMVSGMFSAIQDFIEDSFSTSDEDKLDTLRLGELSVLLQRGPNAILATVVRGRVPEHIRREMITTLESISINKRTALEAYAGDPSDFLDIETELTQLLQSQRKEPEEKRSPWKAVLIILLLLLGVGWWAYQQHQQDVLRENLLNTIANEPGLVVLSSHYDDKQFNISLLADPHAREPANVIPTEHEHFDISFTQYSHLSGLDTIIKKRATAVLQPPTQVSLRVENKVLVLRGIATGDWLVHFNARWPAITGISDTDLSQLTVTYPKREAMNAATRQIESMELSFGKGQTHFKADNALIVSTAAEIKRLSALAIESSGKDISIDVIGYTDETGSEYTNRRVGLARADNLKAALVAAGVKSSQLTTFSAIDYPFTDDSTERKTRLVVHFD